MAEIHHFDEEKSFLDDVSIAAAGTNPFANVNTWWYITGICLFGLLGGTVEHLFFELTKSSGSWEFYNRDKFNLTIYVILPVLFYVTSKILFLVFIYKKWKFISQANAEVPYSGNIVVEKYIRPVIYFTIASFVFALITAQARTYETATVFLMLRGLVLLGFAIYLIVWNYRLITFFPKYFNTIQSHLQNKYFTLPKQIGIFLWLVPILANLFFLSTKFIAELNAYHNSDGDNMGYYTGTFLITASYYGQTLYFIVLAIYIYIIIQSSKQLYNNTTVEE